MAALAPTQTHTTPNQPKTPFPWAMGILRKEDVPTQPSHGNRSHSGSTSSMDSNTIKIIDLTQHEALMRKKDMEYQDRYQSSEEELSPLDEELDDTESFKSFDLENPSEDEADSDGDGEDEEEQDETDHNDDDIIEQAVSAYSDEPESPRKSQELAATAVSIVYSGRPQVVDIHSTPTNSPTRTKPPADEFTFKHGRNWGARPRPRPRSMIASRRVPTLSFYEDVEPAHEQLLQQQYQDSQQPSSSSSRYGTTPEPDEASIISREHRRSSIYSVASPPSPHFFDPLYRNSLVRESRLATSSVADSAAPAASREPKTRHSRMKSISRMGIFGGHKKKDRKDGSSSTSNSNSSSSSSSFGSVSMVHLPDYTPAHPTAAPPPPPTYQPTTGLSRSSTTATANSTFAPPPFIRPQGRLIARGADEREEPIWSSALGSPVHGAVHIRQYDNYGDDELSEDDFTHGRDSEMAAKIRKRRSILGLSY